MHRRYYEVFGDLEAQTEFLKLTALILLLFLFFALLGAFLLAKRPPVVIRVTDVGRAEAIADLRQNNAPTEPEIYYFSKNFVKRFAEYNAYTLARDMAEAMNQMTSSYQKIAQRELIESGLLAKVEEAGLHARIEFKEESIERETPEYLRVALIGVRNVMSYKNPDYRESNLFKAELMLKKVPRSYDVPWGLLVEQYRDIVLNKLEEVSKK
jgi:hypothetical protein